MNKALEAATTEDMQEDVCTDCGNIVPIGVVGVHQAGCFYEGKVHRPEHPSDPEMMVGGPSDTRRWTLDGQPCDILDFIEVNGFAMPDVEQINSLKVGEVITYGGGAAAAFVLRRVR